MWCTPPPEQVLLLCVFISTHLDSSKATTVKNRLEYDRVRVSSVRVHERARNDDNITNMYRIGNYNYYLCTVLDVRAENSVEKLFSI